MTRTTTILRCSAAALALNFTLGACGGDEKPAEPTATAEESTEAEAGPLTVAPEGEGASLLRVVGGDAGSGAESLEGTLISGPGGCLAVQPGGQPELLLFDDAVELAQDPPQVSMGDTAIEVGQMMAADAAPVSLAEVEGVPAECSQGAAETAWVVDSLQAP